MAFGGFFGGGSSNNDKDKDSSTTPSEFAAPQSSVTQPTPLSFSPTSSASSSDVKVRVQQAVAQQSNIANAKALISKVTETCFDHCVTAPGDKLSSRDEGCLSACMEKYIEGWNIVSKSYVGRIQREGPGLLAGAGSADGGSSGVF